MDSSKDIPAGRAAQRPTRRATKVVAGLFSLVALGAIGGALLGAFGSGRAFTSSQTVAVRRGDLAVSVTAGGALQALEALKLLNDAQAPWFPGTDYKRTIVFIVDEGTVITEQDVKDGMVLVRMDSSDLEDRETQTEIWLQSSKAWYAQAKAWCEIQESQNDRDISDAELKVKFARMELDRYLGAGVGAEVVKQKGGFADLADDARLAGVAQQDLRAYAAAVELASPKLSQAEDKLGWANRLHERGYITSTELTADQYSANRCRRELEAAQEELRLFKRYTLPEEAKRRYSDHVESMRNLARVELQARSRLTQAEASLKSSEANCALQQKELDKIRDSIEKCTTRAPKPGRVVYGSTTDPWRQMTEPIQEGQRLWPRQCVISIPDLSALAARVDIQEPDIEKIRLGQPALVSVEAMPGKQFAGTVVRINSVASLPEPETNPDLRFYEVDVAIDGLHEGLGPGMTATAKITVAQRKDVLYLPIGALAVRDGQWLCSIAGSKGPESRRIDLGQITESFVEVKQGLSEGEVVYRRPPEVRPDASARGSGAKSIPAVPVARGDFTVSVAERGAVYSMNPLKIKSEAEGWNVLSEVVDEGTVVTDKDVQDGLVLARFDSSNFEAEESRRQTTLHEAEAAQVQAQGDLEIQKGQNESDIALAELNAEFARMEMQHYLGEDLAAEAAKEGSDPGSFPADARLGGVARQELRNYESQAELATEDLLRAKDRLNWTRNLYQNGQVSRNELMADELSADKLEAQLAAADESQDAFKRYALPVQVWKRCSDCAKMARDLERVKARAASQLTQAEAKHRSCEAVCQVQKGRLDDVRDQIRKCTMRATGPGQVIYGSRDDPIWYRLGDSAIRPGASVEQNRTIIRIPDPSTLAAIVNVSETDIQDIRVGQRALIALEAVPGRRFRGRVAMASPIGKSADESLDPDAKVYETDVALEEAPEHFIPGMSATVEIIVAELHDVLYVPRQAVNKYRGLSFCWVKGPGGLQARRVEVGYVSVRYAEISRGLKAGEEVLLAEPQQSEKDELDALKR